MCAQGWLYPLRLVTSTLIHDAHRRRTITMIEDVTGASSRGPLSVSKEALEMVAAAPPLRFSTL